MKWVETTPYDYWRPNIWERLSCLFLGHEWDEIRATSSGSIRRHCDRCNRRWSFR